MIVVRSRKLKTSAPDIASGHRAEQDDQRITETLKLGCQHQINQQHRKPECHREGAAFLTDLPGLARIIEHDARSVGRGRGGFKNVETFSLRHPRLHAAKDAHGVALLEAVQSARPGAPFDVRKGRHGHKLTARRFDLKIEERSHRRAIFVTDLWNHFVAAVKIVEAVDVGPAEECAELPADAREVEPQISQTLAVQDDAGFREIDFQVRIDVQEFPALPSGTKDRTDRLEHLLRRHIALQHQFDIVLARRRQRRIQTREHPQPRHP